MLLMRHHSYSQFLNSFNKKIIIMITLIFSLQIYLGYLGAHELCLLDRENMLCIGCMFLPSHIEVNPTRVGSTSM